MSNLEHYFENLLFNGQDVKGDWNKNALTEAEQKAVEICADYVLYNLFLNRDDFMKFVNGKDINATTNADRFKAMTVEELADFFNSIVHDFASGDVYLDGKYIDDWEEWLKQEADT